MVAHQTSGADVLGSDPASPTIILMRCKIIVLYSVKHLRVERETYAPEAKKEKNNFQGERYSNKTYKYKYRKIIFNFCDSVLLNIAIALVVLSCLSTRRPWLYCIYINADHLSSNIYTQASITTPLTPLAVYGTVGP